MTGRTRLTVSFLVAVLALALAPSAHAEPGINSAADVKAITAIEEDIASATDMKGLLHYFAPNAVILDFFAPGIYQGRAQIDTAFQAQFAGLKTISHKITEINVASDGRFACDALEVRFDIGMKNGKAMALSLRQLDVFQKIAGQWELVQQHISVPADPKTGMAVMDGPLPARGAVQWGENPFPGPATTALASESELRQWIKGNSEVATIDDLESFFGPDDNALIYNENMPGELRGKAEIRANYGPVLASFKAASVRMPLLDVVSDGLLGAQIDVQKVALTMRNGNKLNVSIRQSDCLRRVGGKWYSFFEMVSYAVDPKTGKAIVLDPDAPK